MTIEGAIAELQNLIKADDVPFYYNGAIQKVIETIIDERPVRCKDCKHSKEWYGDRSLCYLWAEVGVSVFEDGYCNYGERRADDR